MVINPYKNLGIYADKDLHEYNGKPRGECPPHVFAVADSAYRAMMTSKFSAVRRYPVIP